MTALPGLGFVVFAFQLSCYYYAFMRVFELLWLFVSFATAAPGAPA